MSQAELNTRLMPLMSQKLPLTSIIKALSDIPEERVTQTYDALTFEVYDLDRVLEAAA